MATPFFILIRIFIFIPLNIIANILKTEFKKIKKRDPRRARKLKKKFEKIIIKAKKVFKDQRSVFLNIKIKIKIKMAEIY